jgi:hypothetical protein
MPSKKKPEADFAESRISETPEPEGEALVRITITKFGDGKVSTGKHVGGQGDVMARRGDVMQVSAACASDLEKLGFAETDA